jgi:hypothetical protein
LGVFSNKGFGLLEDVATQIRFYSKYQIHVAFAWHFGMDDVFTRLPKIEFLEEFDGGILLDIDHKLTSLQI